MQIVGNYDINYIYYIGLTSMISLVLGFMFMLVSLIFKFKNEEQGSAAFQNLAISLYACSIIILIFWATFTIINQINAIIELLLI